MTIGNHISGKHRVEFDNEEISLIILALNHVDKVPPQGLADKLNKRRVEFNDEEISFVILALNHAVKGDKVPASAQGLADKLTNISKCYVNWDHLDKMTEEEASEMYNDLCRTFLGRDARD